MKWRKLPAAERIQAIRDVHADTGTLSTIAAALSARFGEEITKNAITGMYNRYGAELVGFSLKGKRQGGRKKAEKPKKPAPAPAAAPVAAAPKVKKLTAKAPRAVFVPSPIVMPEPATGTPKRIRDAGWRERGECKFPIEGSGEHALFCCAPAEEKSSWCAHHRERVFGKGTDGERTALRVLRRLAA